MGGALRGENACVMRGSTRGDATTTRHPIRRRVRGARMPRVFFHSRCGRSSGEPVENTFKCLMAQARGHTAEILVMPSSCDEEFSTAVVDVCCTSLWKSPVTPFAYSYLARTAEFFDSFRHAPATPVFPQLLWTRAG